jgi:hypothetical protein
MKVRGRLAGLQTPRGLLASSLPQRTRTLLEGQQKSGEGAYIAARSLPRDRGNWRVSARGSSCSASQLSNKGRPNG